MLCRLLSKRGQIATIGLGDHALAMQSDTCCNFGGVGVVMMDLDALLAPLGVLKTTLDPFRVGSLKPS